jgi:cell division septal protein FtsQ
MRAGRSGRRRPAVTSQGRIGVDLRARSPLVGTLGVLPQPKRRGGEQQAARSKAVANVAMRPQAAAQPGSMKPKRRRGKRRVVLLALVAAQVAFACVAGWTLTSPTWQVRGVRVEGTDDALLVQTIEALPLTGCNIFRCDTSAQTRLVERIPLVAHAQIQAAYPDGLVVNVTPRQPALLWHVGGTAYVIASDGTVLGTRASDPAVASATLQDVQDDGAAAFGGGQPAAGTQIGSQLADMAGQLRKGLLPVLGAGWSLRYTSADGFAAEDTSGMSVEFGTPGDAAQAVGQGSARGVAAQMAELQSLLAALARSGERASVTLIDLRWGRHPYYRLAGA